MNMQPQFSPDMIALPIPALFLLVTIGFVVYIIRKSSVGTWLPSLLAVIVLLIAGGVSGLYMTRMKFEQQAVHQAKQEALEAEVRAREAELRAQKALEERLGSTEDVTVVPVELPEREDATREPVESEKKSTDPAKEDAGEDSSDIDPTETDDSSDTSKDASNGSESVDESADDDSDGETTKTNNATPDSESGANPTKDADTGSDEDSEEFALSPGAVSKLPDWAINGVPSEEATDSDEYIVVSSRKHAFPEDARNDALNKASALAVNYLRTHHTQLSGWRPSKQLILQYAVFRQVHLEEPPKYGRLKLPRHRYYFQVRLWDGLASKMQPSWQADVLNSRVAQLGLGFGFLTLIVGTVSTYLRMDSATNGNHRGKLKFAAIALVTTATAAVSLIS